MRYWSIYLVACEFHSQCPTRYSSWWNWLPWLNPSILFSSLTFLFCPWFYMLSFFSYSLFHLYIIHCLTFTSSARVDLIFSVIQEKEMNHCYFHFTDGKIKEPAWNHKVSWYYCMDCVLDEWYSLQSLSDTNFIWMVTAKQHSWEQVLQEIMTC